MRTGDVFLDRDGVILRSRRDYVKRCAEAEVLDGAVGAIARLCRAGRRVMVVTNQSAIGRGLMTDGDLAAIHRLLSDLVAAAGGEISRYLVCPHRPDQQCACRKPRPGLLLTARDEMDTDLATAYVVGDQVIDLQAAWSTGSHPVLVLSGETRELPEHASGTYLVAADLPQAADLILSTEPEPCPIPG